MATAMLRHAPEEEEEEEEEEKEEAVSHLPYATG